MEQSRTSFDRKYQRGAKIGEGEFGEVSRYVNKQTGHPHAGKMMKAQNLQHFANLIKQIDTIRELKHSNLIKMENYFVQFADPEKGTDPFFERKTKKLKEKQTGARVGILMELAERNLEEQIEERSKNFNFFTIQEVQKIIISTVSFFAYMERSGFIHRDIKPANILLLIKDGKSEYKVSDLGLSVCLKYYDQETVAGTYSYASPRLRVKFKDHKKYIPGNTVVDDVYSLGMTLLHICALEYIEPSKKVYKFIQQLYGQEIALTIFSMLSEENQRPTFVQLYKHLKISLVDQNCRNSNHHHLKQLYPSATSFQEDQNSEHFNKAHKKLEQMKIRTVRKPSVQLNPPISAHYLEQILQLPSEIQDFLLLTHLDFLKIRCQGVFKSGFLIVGICAKAFFVHTVSKTLMIKLPEETKQLKFLFEDFLILSSNSRIYKINSELVLSMLSKAAENKLKKVNIKEIYHEVHQIPIQNISRFEWDYQNQQFIFGTEEANIFLKNRAQTIQPFRHVQGENKIVKITQIDGMIFVQGIKTLAWFSNIKYPLIKKTKKFKAPIEDFKVLYKEGEILFLVLLVNGSIAKLDSHFEENNTFVISKTGIFKGVFGSKADKNITFVDFQGNLCDEEGKIAQCGQILAENLKLKRKGRKIFFSIQNRLKVLDIQQNR